MEYPTLQQANAARQREWLGEVKLPLTFRTNEMAGELGEVAEALLDRWTAGSHMHGPWKDHLVEEMADVVICAEITAWQLNERIDYARAEGLAQSISTDYRWATQCSRDMGLLCNAAKKMDRTAYGIAGGIPVEEGRALVLDKLQIMVGHVYDLAFHEHVYMEVGIARKFNKTSAKIGLQTMYIPPGHDRALLVP